MCILAIAGSFESGLLRSRNEAFDAIVVTGIGGEDCESLADVLRSEGSDVPLIFRLGGWDVRLSARWAHAGATSVYGPDASLDEVLHEADRLASEHHCHARRQFQECEPWRKTIIGQCEGIRRVCEVIARVANRKSTVLITGESGTGKEVVARAIHMASGRSKRAMLSVNCAAIPEGLLESELFGHVRGAFTGAVQQRAGLFEQASGGPVFLDEIGDMPLGLQAKLLRVVQEQQFQRLGSSETIRVDVRIIAATNTKLELLIQEGRFREDLFYRLNVVGIAMPALRDRHEDIALLATHFIEKICRAEHLPVKTIMPAAMSRLYRQSWPGNVRQLQNVIERAVVLGAEERVVLPGDIDVPEPAGPSLVQEIGAIDTTHGLDYERTVQAFERNILEQALKQTAGNKTRAAELLRLGRTTLAAKLRVLGNVAWDASVSDSLIARIAERVQPALPALRLAGNAKRPAMKNNLVREENPSIARNNLHQVPLDCYRIVVLRQIEPTADALHVGIDHHAGGNSVGGAQHHVSGLAGRTRNRDEFLQGSRNVAAELVDYFPGRADDRLRFVVKETCRPDIVRQHFRGNGREIARGRIFCEQPGGDFVDALVGALRGKNRRHQQFPGVAMNQGAGGVRIHLVQTLKNGPDARLALGFCFWLARHHSYRKTSTGVMRVALRAGYNVASRLTDMAAAAIQTPSQRRASNGTKLSA